LISFLVGDEVRVVRGCGWIPNEGYYKDRECYQKAGTHHVILKSCHVSIIKNNCFLFIQQVDVHFKDWLQSFFLVFGFNSCSQSVTLWVECEGTYKSWSESFDQFLIAVKMQSSARKVFKLFKYCCLLKLNSRFQFFSDSSFPLCLQAGWLQQRNFNLVIINLSKLCQVVRLS
jgi:hypothetical protein